MKDGYPTGPSFQGRFRTQAMESRDQNEQESDMMERLPTREVASDVATDSIPLVSLGCSCGPKMSFKEIGRGAETLPFDWVRTTLDGIMHFLLTDFDKYFDFVTEREIPLPQDAKKSMHMYRGPLHSFWHDNPKMPSMLERYRRRIVRFNSFSAEEQPVLFVRSAASSEEVLYANLLVQLLIQRFGAHASLLLIVDFQPAGDPEAVVFEDEKNLMYFCMRHRPVLRLTKDPFR
jgi:hypothetical protein